MLFLDARRLTYLSAVLFGAVGAVLFVVPGWAAENFAWQISPFLAMTMGGWFLGAAAFAFEGARVWRWSAAHPALIFVWAFALLETLIPLHLDLVRVTPFGLAYVVVLLAGCLAAVAGIAEWVRARSAASEPGAARQPWFIRLSAVAFDGYVGLLVVLLVDGVEPNGAFWPGPLSLIAARSFAVFFFSLVLGELALVFARDLASVEAFMRPGFITASVILIAAVFFIRQFDFADRPGGLLYVGSYVVAVVGAVVILGYGWWSRRREAAPAAAV